VTPFITVLEEHLYLQSDEEGNYGDGHLKSPFEIPTLSETLIWYNLKKKNVLIANLPFIAYCNSKY
jgi:hypothetical protein